MNDDNKNIALIKRLHNIWNDCNLNDVDNVYSNNFIVHWPTSWGGKSEGIDNIKQSIRETHGIFHGWNENILDLIVSGDRVVTRYLSSGIHSLSGNEIEFQEVSIYKIHNSKVIEQWCFGDEDMLESQIKSIKSQ